VGSVRRAAAHAIRSTDAFDEDEEASAATGSFAMQLGLVMSYRG
jgi:hypothetical protein